LLEEQEIKEEAQYFYNYRRIESQSHAEARPPEKGQPIFADTGDRKMTAQERKAKPEQGQVNAKGKQAPAVRCRLHIILF
jgi:hypothetical protein